MKLEMLLELQNQNETCFNSLIDADLLRNNFLSELKRQFAECNIDSFFFETIKKDLLKGNFDVLYLDDRMVGEDKKRLKLQKWLVKAKSQMYKMQKQGLTTLEIILK